MNFFSEKFKPFFETVILKNTIEIIIHTMTKIIIIENFLPTLTKSAWENEFFFHLSLYKLSALVLYYFNIAVRKDYEHTTHNSRSNDSNEKWYIVAFYMWWGEEKKFPPWCVLRALHCSTIYEFNCVCVCNHLMCSQPLSFTAKIL